MTTFHFELVSPEKLLFSGEVESVVVPGSEGQFTMLANHSPFMTTLRPGILEVEEAGSGKQRLFVRGGFADVSASGLTVLAEQAIPMAEFNAEMIAFELKLAEDDLAMAVSEESRRIATQKLDQLKELSGSL